jgi:hypothetical protein
METEDYILQRLNIMKFSNEFRTETDPQKRQTLRERLIYEEDRFGRHKEQLDIANESITASLNRIFLQEQHLTRLTELGSETTLARETLLRFQEVLDLQIVFRKQVSDFLASQP